MLAVLQPFHAVKIMKNVGWWKRLFSDKAQQLPVAVQNLLRQYPLEVVKYPDAGRGLAATRDIQQGETVLMEQPFVCCPAIANRKKVCYHCLKVLPSPQDSLASSSLPSTIHTKGRTFCSPDCLAAASQAYYSLEAQLDLRQLDHYCDQHSERFPLLAARLALTAAQAAMSSTAAAAAEAEAAEAADSEMARSSTSSSRALSTSSWLGRLSKTSSRSGAGGIGRLSAASSLDAPVASVSCGSRKTGVNLADVNAALSMLCFANVPAPPPLPWQTSHSLLLDAVEAVVGCREDNQQDAALAAILQQLDMEWYMAVLSRLHLNTFKVDAMMDIDWSRGHAAAAALLGAGSSSGSALYLLASLFNHSCEPNINVSFPQNDSTAKFTAARDVAAGEQLWISYIDAEQEVYARQDYLAFAYGFRCGCTRCQEELADAAKDAPPQL